ncbi:DUF1648 domain-containing protein [Litchfieldia alkalitelluris]|uniref:DUF1648 domain-containing protein n=1 Tax=Litchfieldia alkalitelluris TaxID=304268 RepID=UPI000995F0AB|nr:DUF1648 domain-containing protein [Litchfieldia alkalitelluris]
MKNKLAIVLPFFIAIAISIVAYAHLPERMVVHFNFAENPDNWMRKPLGAFLLPIIMLLTSFIITFSVKFEKNENKRRRTKAVIGSVTAIVSMLILSVHAFIIAYNLGYDFGVATFVTIVTGALFILLGNLVPRLPQGSMQWPVLPGPVLQKVSRFHGGFMVILGCLFLLLAFLPSNYILPLFFLLLASFIITIIISTIRYIR